MTDNDALRIVGAGTMGGIEIRPLTGAKRETMTLLDLEEAGYRIFRQGDFDRRYPPWLIAKDDDTIWTVEHGIPWNGVNRDTHAVLVDDDLRWGFLVSAKASGRKDAPSHVGELAGRAKRAEDEAKRQAAERERNFQRLRKSAVPVTSGDVNDALKFTLAAAHEKVLQAGGKVEIRDNRLIVCLPPGAGKMWTTEQTDAAHVLYLAEPAVVALLAKGQALPDKPVTPAGAVIAS
jgi:hypothetical protein